MAYEIQQARVAGPVSYESGAGAMIDLPYGPCLIERIDNGRAHVIWGDSGEYSAALPLAALVHAEKRGTLVLLD